MSYGVGARGQIRSTRLGREMVGADLDRVVSFIVTLLQAYIHVAILIVKGNSVSLRDMDGKE